MGIIKDIKCLLCLFKCSKYLYYAKKALCAVTLLIAAATALKVCRFEKKKLSFLKGMM